MSESGDRMLANTLKIFRNNTFLYKSWINKDKILFHNLILHSVAPKNSKSSLVPIVLNEHCIKIGKGALLFSIQRFWL